MKSLSFLKSFRATARRAHRSLPDSARRPAPLRRTLAYALVAGLALGAWALPSRGQDAAPPPEAGPAAPPPPDGGAPAPTPRAGNGRVRGNYNGEAMMAALRKRLGVTDDAEWSLIATRITAVRTLQRSAGGFGGMRGGSPEQQALREAVTDQLPDAEIKARLERLRAVRKENEAKLNQARADLLAVLTVRQEATLVMMGLLQ